MFKEINLRNHSSLHKLFYSLNEAQDYIVTYILSINNIYANYKRAKKQPALNTITLKLAVLT
jgi:hypothetical protein